MLCIVFFFGTATSSTYLQSRCFVTVVWKIFLEECQRKKGLLFVKSKFISTIFNKYLFIVAWVVKCNINVTIFYCLQKEEHAITGLQSQVRSKRPNEPLLQKLKEEMMKIQMQRVKLCCKCITPKCDGFPKPDGHAKVRWSVPNPNGVTRQSPMVCTKVSWLQ